MMIKHVWLAVLPLVLSIFSLSAQQKTSVTIVYDNIPYIDSLETSWGFAAFVEHGGKRILFDTGGKEDLLIENMRKLGIDTNKIDYIVLSHEHWDHIGGLVRIIEKNKGITVYVPGNMRDNRIEMIKIFKGNPKPINRYLKFSDGITLVHHPESEPAELSMILATSRGPVLITGCAHAGIEKVVEQTGEFMDGKYFMIMGGFHMHRMPGNQIEDVVLAIKNEGVQFVVPTHCTGEGAIESFREIFGDNFIRAGLGKKIVIEYSQIIANCNKACIFA